MSSPSVTFKPQQQLSRWDPSIKHVVWTEERDTLPPALAGHVDLKTWQQTFDAVVDLHKKRYNGVNYTLRLPVVSTVALPYNVYSRVDYESNWRKLREEQAKIYQALGVKVTLVQGHARKGRTITVGLKFDVLPEIDAKIAEPDVTFAFRDAEAKVEMVQ